MDDTERTERVRLLVNAATLHPLAPGETLERPEWEAARRVHDWRNYIHDGLRELWPSLTATERLLAYYFASDQAESEEWE